MEAIQRSVLSCSDVTKSFGGVHALRGVTMSVGAGEIVGLIGPNGSGKSTLLHCFGGAANPSSGRIFLSGQDVTGMKPFQLSRRGVARTFQQNRVFNDMTVLENLLVSRDWNHVRPLTQLRAPTRVVRDRAEYLLSVAGLARHGNALASEISGGQRRLVEIAMALMPEPLVIMLDEATSGVNPTMIREFVAYLKKINETENCAMVVVEHNLQFITELTTKVVALEQGRVLAQGSPNEVMADTRVVEAYLGA